MVQVKFIEADGAERTVNVGESISLMQAARALDVGGIVGECGGSAMCATCQVYVDEAWLDQLEPPGEVEEEMLECTTSERQRTSRLSCQIWLEQSIDGLTVHLPATQI